VDIIFFADGGCDCRGVQEELARTSEGLLRELLFPTADRATGLLPRPVRDLHVGVSTMAADMAGYQYFGCTEPENGALLLDSSSIEQCGGALALASDCEAPPCPWLGHSVELPNAGEEPGDPPIWEELACLVRRASFGCGWEQPLEASRLAVTTQCEPGAANDGFLRDDSVLALVFVAGEDDCSVSDPALFDPARDLGFPTTRCHLHPEMLHPVASTIEALRTLRPGLEDRIVIGVFHGLPVDAGWQPGDPVEDLRDLVRVDPSDPQMLVPRCYAQFTWAFPAPRLVELAYAFGDGAFIASRCEEDWSEAMMGLARTIQRRLE
jgi:hypothetical protein